MPNKEKYEPRKRTTRRLWDASAYVCEDWPTTDLADMLEDRARGYSGFQRQILCTAAARLRGCCGTGKEEVEKAETAEVVDALGWMTDPL